MTYGIILISLLVGTWTHIFWDAFTHEHGWYVDRLPPLQQAIAQIGSTTVYMFLFLQELSTAVGFALVVVVYWRWLRRARATVETDSSSDGWRYLLWGGVLLFSFGLSVPIAIHFATAAGLRDVLFVRSIAFRTAIYSPAIAVPVTLVSTGVVYARRARRTSFRADLS